MRLRCLFVCLAVGIFASGTVSLSAQEQIEGVEVLARGPLHEAFASALSLAPQAGLTVKTAPPEEILEVPPDQKPAGGNIAWIPGYWAWDDDRDDFIWISGTWRAIPPGRQWIAGYWSKAGGGYQWISGYWADAQLAEVRYYPEPPKSLEIGPSTDPPSTNHVWIPGVWLWHEGGYAWRPGYWMLPQANWVWVPSNWVWTPAGCVFVDGYWDYAIPRRGIVFAPIYVAQRVYTQPNYSYTPTLVLNPGIFVSHIFLRPAYQHYYFGDYYAANYASLGIYPQVTYQYRYGFDPLFAYQTWQHRDDRNWLQTVQQNYQRLERDVTARPPQTFDPRWVNASLDGDVGSNIVATSLTQVAKIPSTSYRFEKIVETERRQLARNAQEIREQRQERQQVVQGSARVDATAKTGAKSEPVTVKLKQSPISAASLAASAGIKTPEGTRRETLKPGLTDREPDAKEPSAREPGAKPKGKGPPPDRTPPGREPKPPLDGEPQEKKDPFAPKEPMIPKASKEPLPGEQPPKKPEKSDLPPPSPEKNLGTKGEQPPVPDRPKTPPRPDREKSPKAATPPRPAEERDLEKPKSGAPKLRPRPDEDPFAPRPEPRAKGRPEPREPAAPPPMKTPSPKEPTPKAPAPKEPPKVEPEPVKPAPPGRGSEPKSPPKGNKDKDKEKDKDPKKKDKPENPPKDDLPK